jgi:uncharacterized RDD family membrane protein YckC
MGIPGPSGMSGIPMAQGPGAYASWGQRFAAYLLNAVPIFALYILGAIVATVLGKIAGILGGLAFLVVWAAAVALSFYTFYLDGLGQSPGKAIMGIRVISEQTGQPIGGGMGIARYFVHMLDALPCYIGFFFPLWDAKRQTFADKILNTVVVPGPKLEFAEAYKRLIPKKPG